MRRWLKSWWKELALVVGFIVFAAIAVYLNYLRNKARFPDAPDWSNWL